MNYKNITLTKSLYNERGGFSKALERLDPSEAYKGTELSGLDAFERQLKRFDIKLKGEDCDRVSKFFSVQGATELFPEFLARTVRSGFDGEDALQKIIAVKTTTDAMDYRAVSVSDGADFSPKAVNEGDKIPEAVIGFKSTLLKMHKRGRLLSASYEALKFQKLDVVSVALKEIGRAVRKQQLADAVAELLGKGSEAAEEINVASSGNLTYLDLLNFWSRFSDFTLNTMLCSPGTAVKLLALPEMRDAAAGLNFHGAGSVITPMGAELLVSSAVPDGKLLGLDRSFALEMVDAGFNISERDRLIERQLERVSFTFISGFSKLFKNASKVLVIAK